VGNNSFYHIERRKTMYYYWIKWIIETYPEDIAIEVTDETLELVLRTAKILGIDE